MYILDNIASYIHKMLVKNKKKGHYDFDAKIQCFLQAGAAP